MQQLSLKQLLQRVQRSISINFPEPVWIEAEVSQLKSSRGHWYVDLVQKSESDDRIIAQINAVIWKNVVKKLEGEWHNDIGSILQEGRNVLFEATVEYHQVFGLKLMIKNIDSSYTEGLLQKQRAQTINYLVENKLFDRNKQLPFPDVIQQIALISNESAAGYIDFIDQLENNTHGFQFNVTLFRSALQGQAVANEFPEAVERINKSNNFDVIVIIRGGGSKMDLSAFDSLEAAKAVANSKYPVITGIGHEIDETVCDLIASVRMKTPTAVASYIIEHNARYEKRLSELCEQVNQIIKLKWTELDRNLDKIFHNIKMSVDRKIQEHHRKVMENWNLLYTACGYKRREELQMLNHKEELLKELDPIQVLKKGYSILLAEGKPVENPEELTPGTTLVNKLVQGTIFSTFQNYDANERKKL